MRWLGGGKVCAVNSRDFCAVAEKYSTNEGIRTQTYLYHNSQNREPTQNKIIPNEAEKIVQRNWM